MLDRLVGVGLCALMLAALPGDATAQVQLSERDIQQTGEADAEVRGALRDRAGRLQTEVIYLRPDAGFRPDEEIELKVPEPEPEQTVDRDTERWTWGLIFAAILIAIIAVFISQGGAIGVSFGRQAEDRDRAGADRPAGPDEFDAINRQPLDQFLASLRQMADKRMALILLVSRALERAADQNQVRLGRAQTARDVVRILPRGWPHLGTLRGLVREAEIVHFGGRDISDEKWEECLAAAEPIFQRRVA